MTDIDKRIIRAWSALVARGAIGHPFAVAGYAELDPDLVEQRMRALRAIGALPPAGLEAVS